MGLKFRFTHRQIFMYYIVIQDLWPVESTNVGTSIGSVCVLVAQSCLTLCDPHGLEPTRLLCPGNSLGKDTGVGSHSLLQEIFPTQGSNPGLLQCRWILYFLSHQRSPLNFQVLQKFSCCWGGNWGTRAPQHQASICQSKVYCTLLLSTSSGMHCMKQPVWFKSQLYFFISEKLFVPLNVFC